MSRALVRRLGSLWPLILPSPLTRTAQTKTNANRRRIRWKSAARDVVDEACLRENDKTPFWTALISPSSVTIAVCPSPPSRPRRRPRAARRGDTNPKCCATVRAMSVSVLAASVLGVGLGLKHAFEADHVAAVCTFVARGGSVSRAAWTGAIWGLGHAAVLVVLGSALVMVGVSVPKPVAIALDVAVAVMLCGLGISAFLSRRRAAAPEHLHPEAARRPFAVGLLHGASGTAALTLLVASTMQTRAAALLFIALFGLSSIACMALVATLVAWPLRSLTRRAPSFAPRLQMLAGLGSLAAGVSIAWSML